MRTCNGSRARNFPTASINASPARTENQDAVAHVLSHEAIESSDRLRDALLIRADYRTQIFGIELCGERSRADEVREHDSQLATLGVVSPGWFDHRGRRTCRHGNTGTAKITDRAQHFQPVAERDTEVFEVLLGQIGEDGNIDPVLDKALGVLGHAESFEPVRHLFHRDRQPAHRGQTELFDPRIPKFIPTLLG
jgi:hypothetical protein